eukprot:1825245-Ditylum_brightwellii.AAC.1
MGGGKFDRAAHKNGNKWVQGIVGALLYYSRAVDPTLAAALSTIGSQQATTTKQTKEACHQLLDYIAMHPNATIRFMASDKILAVHSDASYLSETKARSREAGHFYLANKNDEEYNNGAILTLSTIIRHVVASASKAELADLFYNAREAVPICVTLEEMGHPQPPTPLITDNNTVHGLTTGTMMPKRSKAVDMCFHWLKYREVQRQFDIKWKRWVGNRADYH